MTFRRLPGAVRRIAILAAAIASLSSPARAADPYLGTWAPDGMTCKDANFHWVFEVDKAHNEAFACERVAYVQLDGDRWVAHMSHCKSSDSHFATDEHFTLNGDKMDWRDKHFHRCLFDTQ